PVDVDDNDRPRAIFRRGDAAEVELAFELRVARLAELKDLPAAVKARKARGPRERAEQEDDATVLTQVRSGLGAAADQIEVRDASRPEDAQGLDRPLGRKVQMPAVPARRGGDEEQRLAPNPGTELLVDGLVDLAHGTRRDSKHAAVTARAETAF